MSNLDFSRIPKDQLEAELNKAALSPPPGEVSNFENPHNKNAVSLVALVLCLVVSFTFLLIRMYVRFFILRQRHIVDYIIAGAYPFYIIIITGCLRRITSASGVFVHQWNIRGRDMEDYLHAVFIGICCWVVTMLLIKASVLLEWIRIFAPTNSRSFFSWSCRIMLALNISFYCAVVITFNLSCSPQKRIWDKTVPGSCIDMKVLSLVVTVINCLLDIAILVLPQRVIWELQMTRKKKIGISTVFAVGITACATAAALVESVVKWLESDDMTYHHSHVVLWGIAESTCGILVLCVPVAPTAFRGFKFPKWPSTLESWITSSSIRTGSRVGKRAKGFFGRILAPEPHSLASIKILTSPARYTFKTSNPKRPTDQQYGIVCTTDITVVETYEPTVTNDHNSPQYPWLGVVQKGQSF